MGLFGRMKAAAGVLVHGVRAENTLTEYASLPDALREMLRVEPSLSGVRVSPERAQGVPAVYAAVRIIRTTLAHLPLVLYESTGNTRRPLTSDPLYGLLHDRPNEWQTSLEWRELLAQDLELRGNAYSLIVRGGLGVVELLRLHPDTVEPMQADDMTITYRHTKKNGRRVDYRRDQIFHVRGAGDNGVVGVNPIRLHRETIGEAIAAQQHGSRFYSNGAKPLGIIESDVGVRWDSDESRDTFKREFAEAYAGGENAHKPMLLPPGHKYTAVSISAKDAQYIEGRKFTRGEIFSIFGIPPHKAGDLDKATFSNIEHQALEFVTDAIVPRCVRFEQAIKRDLIGDDPNRYAKHNVDALLRGDAKSRAEALQIKRLNGALTANEWRELDDQNPREDAAGNLFIIPANMRYDDGTTPAPQPPKPQSEQQQGQDQ